MKLAIEIELNTAAFFDDDGNHRAAFELKRILSDLASRVYDDDDQEESADFVQPIFDRNGNSVGRVALIVND